MSDEDLFQRVEAQARGYELAGDSVAAVDDVGSIRDQEDLGGGGPVDLRPRPARGSEQDEPCSIGPAERRR